MIFIFGSIFPNFKKGGGGGERGGGGGTQAVKRMMY